MFEKYPEIAAGEIFRYELEPEYGIVLEVIHMYEGVTVRIVRLGSSYTMEVGFIPEYSSDANEEYAKELGVRFFEDNYEMVHREMCTALF